jgi:uncharacterized membrane protein
MRRVHALAVSLAATLTVSTPLLAQKAPMPTFQQIPPPSGHSLGSVTGGHFKQAQLVIEDKCISCHGRKVIDDAIAAGKNMQKIQQRMEQKGVKLSADERTVLGVFWKATPLRNK